jgi:hypothetical protein
MSASDTAKNDMETLDQSGEEERLREQVKKLLLLPSALSGSEILDKRVRRLGEGLDDIPTLFSGR